MGCCCSTQGVVGSEENRMVSQHNFELIIGLFLAVEAMPILVNTVNGEGVSLDH